MKIFIRNLAILCVVLLLTEIMLRAFILSPSRSIYHPLLGSIWQSNTTLLSSDEGYSHLNLNSYGLNDTEPNLRAHRRILALGDSYTAAVHVPQNKNYTALLEHYLQDTDILNTGRNGLNPLTFAPMLEEYLPTYPATEVVVFLNHSDLRDIVRYETKVSTNTAGAITHVTHQTFPQSGLRWKIAPIMHHSALATYMLKRAETALKEPVENLRKILPSLADNLTAERQYREINTADAAAYLPIAVYLLNELKALTPKLTLIYIPSFDYNAVPPQQTQRDQVTEIFFKQAAQQATIPFYSLTDTFREDFTKTGKLPTGFQNSHLGQGHLNEYGHTIVAKAVAEILR